MGSIRIDDKFIYINEKRTKIMSGAMHYFRVIPEYWEDRLLKLKEMGCNCVETYVCWNLHEKTEGDFDFSGQLDLNRFISLAEEMGLYVIVRPGPFICSEWDFGGLPWWLLSLPDIKLRCMNERFIEKITPYLEKVCEIIRPHLITNDGKIIFVQIENEYGSYGNDKQYLQYLRDLYIKNNIDCAYITSDGETEFLLHNGTLPDVMASVNYRKDSERCLASLQKYHGNQPGAVLELWNGRQQHWGEEIVRRDVEEVAESVKTALENAELINLYMYHGGTNFGFMNGALDFVNGLIVQRTSYDVDAPLDEYGRRTPKYYAEQKVICQHFGLLIQNTAKDTILHDYGTAIYVGETSLENHAELMKKSYSASVQSMEEYGQGYGYIIYTMKAFFGVDGGRLLLPEIHDIAHVYVDGKYINTLYRNTEKKEVELKITGEHDIAILVENMGRVNYGINLYDKKGLIGDINFFDIEYNVYSKLFGINAYALELKTLPKTYMGKAKINAPAFYQYFIEIDECKDTILHVDGFTRGVALINGFNLGRHWTIEHSENKLYVPAPLLKKGKNEIIIFDVLATNNEKSVCLTND